MTKEQRVNAWKNFAAEVEEHIRANTTDVKASYQETFSLKTVTDSIRLLAEHIGNSHYLESSKQECLSIASLAQLAWEKLKSFNTRQAVECLKQGKAVRPVGEPRLVVLTIYHGHALSDFVNNTLSSIHELKLEDHLLILYPSGDVCLTRDLPPYPEWVLASEEEINNAANRAAGKAES